MSVPVSATEELVVAARAVVSEAIYSARPSPAIEALQQAITVWNHDKDLPQAAKADRIEVPVQVPIPVYMTDPEVLDRAADILEDKLGDVKGFLRKANNKALLQILPELARKMRRGKRGNG